MFSLLSHFAVQVFLYNDVSKLRKRRLIEGTLREVYNVYLSEAQNPIPPPLHTVYVYTVYTYSHREGGGELNQREGDRGNRSQS
jgi:hypothetical protein